MKKILFSIVTLITFGITNAQIKDKGTLEITPKIGVSSFAESNGDETSDYNSGIEFSTTIDYYFNNRWSLRSGFVYDKMGYTSSSAIYKYEDKLNYVSIPLNANWHFGSTRKWNLNFGLSPSFLISATENETGQDLKISSDYINSFQLGLTYGIGYKIELNKKFGILIDAQFFNGLTKALKYDYYETVNLGYSLNVGGVFQL